MAPPRKPTELKRRNGNPGKRQLPEPRVMLQALETPPMPPARLAGVGRGLWQTIWQAGTGWLAASDVPLVGLLCETADQRHRWLALVEKAGPTFVTEKGYVGLHPGVSQLRLLTRDMVLMLGLIGFSPSDRSRLGLAEVKRVSGLADLIERRRRAIGR